MLLTEKSRSPDGIIVLKVQGDINLKNSSRFQKETAEILADGPWRIVFDLLEVNFLDSAGMGELLRLKKEAMARGGDARLILGGRLRKTFNLVAFPFQVFENEERAVASFRTDPLPE